MSNQESVDSDQGLSCGDYPGSAKIILKLTIVEFFNQRLDGFSEINHKIFEFEALLTRLRLSFDIFGIISDYLLAIFHYFLKKSRKSKND